jgi:hypothetical protein
MRELVFNMCDSNMHGERIKIVVDSLDHEVQVSL